MTRIYYMSQGHVLPNFPGQVINRDIADLSYQRRLVQTPAFDMFSRELFLRRFSTFDQHLYEQRTQSIYSPLIFVPQALIGRYLWWKFDFPILPTIMLQKFAGLLMYIAGAYVMIRKAPYAKWVLAALALMPSALYQAVTINADGFTIAVSFAFIGWVVHVYINEADEVQPRSVWVLFLLSLLLGAAKPGAFVLLPLLLILYKHQFPAKTWSLLLITGVLLAIAVNIGWWGIAVKNSPFIQGGENRISSQLIDGLKDPSKLLFPLLQSIVVTFPSLVKGWAAIYGYGAGVVPPLVYLFSFVFLLAAFLSESQKTHIFPTARYYLLAVFVVGCFVVYSLVFIADYSGGEIIKLSKHGRYNIPFTPLFFLAVSGLFTLRTDLQIWVRRFVFASLLLTHLYFSAGIYTTYYTYCGNAVLTKSACFLPIYKNLEKESGITVGLNDGETITQAFTNQCGELESVDVFIESKPESGIGNLRFSLLDMDGDTLASHEFSAGNINNSNYTRLPVKLPDTYENKDFQIELTAVGTQFPEKFRFTLTPRDYYPGKLKTGDGTAIGDLIIHYTCSTP